MIVLKTEPESRHVLNIDGTVATKGKTKKPTARREAADETTSSERLTALVEKATRSRIVAKNPSAPVSLLRVSRSEDEATRKNVILNPFTPYDVLSLHRLFVNNPALESKPDFLEYSIGVVHLRFQINFNEVTVLYATWRFAKSDSMIRISTTLKCRLKAATMPSESLLGIAGDISASTCTELYSGKWVHTTYSGCG